MIISWSELNVAATGTYVALTGPVLTINTIASNYSLIQIMEHRKQIFPALIKWSQTDGRVL